MPADQDEKVDLDVAARAREAAFEDLYRERYAPMVRVAALLVDRTDLAEEMVQDAFARLYSHWGQVDSPRAYLRTAVVNRCNDALRRRRRAAREAPPGEPVSGPPDPLWDAIAGLPRRQRIVIVLRFYEDLDLEEIAAVIGARPGTARSLLHRALTNLRGVIER